MDVYADKPYELLELPIRKGAQKSVDTLVARSKPGLFGSL